MEKILVSRCLLGDEVRYDGKHCLIDHPLIKTWQNEGRLISLCPEVAGGLSIPRLPAEIQDGQGQKVISGEAKVINIEGEDVSIAFIEGAEKAAQLCQKHNIRVALLKARSPSCGNSTTYDGSFSGQLTDGVGVTAAYLNTFGIRVFNEQQLVLLADYVSQLENSPT